LSINETQSNEKRSSLVGGESHTEED